MPKRVFELVYPAAYTTSAGAQDHLRSTRQLPPDADTGFWAAYARFYPELEGATPYRRLLEDISAFLEVRDGDDWLDAGCGPGSTMRLILGNSRTAQVVGIDYCPRMIRHARMAMDWDPDGRRCRRCSPNCAVS